MGSYLNLVGLEGSLGKGQPDNGGGHKDSVGRGGGGATVQTVKEKMVRQEKSGDEDNPVTSAWTLDLAGLLSMPGGRRWRQRSLAGDEDENG